MLDRTAINKLPYKDLISLMAGDERYPKATKKEQKNACEFFIKKHVKEDSFKILVWLVTQKIKSPEIQLALLMECCNSKVQKLISCKGEFEEAIENKFIVDQNCVNLARSIDFSKCPAPLKKEEVTTA